MELSDGQRRIVAHGRKRARARACWSGLGQVLHGDLLGSLLATELPPRAKMLTCSPWLFPGAHPGRPITPDALGLRLGSYGIDAREARNTVLRDLGAELAPAFLADLLGST